MTVQLGKGQDQGPGPDQVLCGGLCNEKATAERVMSFSRRQEKIRANKLQGYTSTGAN